jgi:hypothetical protein
MLDTEMEQIIATIVDSLFSVCVTLGIKLDFFIKTKSIFFPIKVQYQSFDVLKAKQLKLLAKLVSNF